MSETRYIISDAAKMINVEPHVFALLGRRTRYGYSEK